MNDQPLVAPVAFWLGPAPVTVPVAVTWAIMALLLLGAFALTRRLTLRPRRTQAALELFVGALDAQVRSTVEGDPAPYRALTGTLFVFILAANWSTLLPGVEPPTATLETDAALAALVFLAAVWHGVRTGGVLGYLATFARPSWVMVPLNLVEQITRTFSLMVRLFGNVMSGVFVVGIVLSLAALLVPVPLMALELLIGAVQAYIFAVLATVFVAAGVGEGQDRNKENA